MPVTSQHHYEKLEQYEHEDESILTQRTQSSAKSGWKSIAFSAVAGAVISFAIFAMVVSRIYPHIRYKAVSSRPCGHSAEAAKAAGCIFDPMMNSWLAEDCYDKELSLEFRNWRNWTFYADEAATKPLTMEEFSRAGSCWGTWEYHIAHCNFAARKLQRALWHGRKLERTIASEEHTKHCLNTANVTFTLIQRAKERGEHFSMQDMGTILHTGYPTCLEIQNYLPFKGIVN